MQILAEKRSEELLEKEGFPIAKRCFVKSEKDALNKARALKYPLVMKVSSGKIIHKSDVNGVIANIFTDSAVKSSFKKLKRIKNADEVMLQQSIEGHQLLVGIKKDEVFGHAIALGAGGIYTEILKDVTFRVCPVTLEDAKSMVNDLKINSVLKGARNTKPIDFKALYSFIIKLSNLPKRYPNLQELDINPLFVSDKKILVADARMVFA